MIGIKECSLNVLQVLKSHENFVCSKIINRIDFYIELLRLFEDIEKGLNISNSDIQDRVLKIKNSNNLPEYKYLLNFILKAEKKVNNEKELFLLQFKENWIVSGKMKEIIEELFLLKKHVQTIISMDFSKGLDGHWRFYRELIKRLTNINFLFPAIIDYDNWFCKLSPNEPWGPYQLTSALQINTCPYCNRSYVFTVVSVKGKKISRPQLDHFIPQSKHPLMALSFFNLIPACSICNAGIKGSQPINYKSHLNPYALNPKHSLIRFSYYPKSYEASIGLTADYEIYAQYSGDKSDLELQKKVEGNIDLFCLNQLYKCHGDIVQEIIQKRRASSDGYLQMLINIFPQLNLSYEDAYRLSFGNYYHESEFHKRPLSKLTKDIAIELGTLIDFKAH